MPIRIILKVSDENIDALKAEYKEQTGREPSKRWIRSFLKADAENYYGEAFKDNLGDAVANSIEE